jgi:ribosomal protein S18 acetylase RimI-like enzyme
VIAVRAAGPDDVEAIVQLTAAGWRRAYPGIVPAEAIEGLPITTWRSEITRGLASPEGDSFTLIAEDQGRTRGYVFVAAPGRESEGPDEAELVAIYVDPRRWRCGIGRALLEKAVAAAGAAGYAEMTLWSFEQNAQALAFYDALGWGLTPQRRPHRSTGAPTVRLRRSLS